jgi:hypothetical protein
LAVSLNSVEPGFFLSGSTKFLAKKDTKLMLERRSTKSRIRSLRVIRITSTALSKSRFAGNSER